MKKRDTLRSSLPKLFGINGIRKGDYVTSPFSLKNFMSQFFMLLCLLGLIRYIPAKMNTQPGSTGSTIPLKPNSIITEPRTLLTMTLTIIPPYIPVPLQACPFLPLYLLNIPQRPGTVNIEIYGAGFKGG
jgi:hypothetical protein